MKLKVTTVGNSAGVVLPKELMARMRLAKGDELFVTELPDGFKLSPFDPEFAAQMEVVDGVMKRRRTLLRKLADN